MNALLEDRDDRLRVGRPSALLGSAVLGLLSVLLLLLAILRLLGLSVLRLLRLPVRGLLLTVLLLTLLALLPVLLLRRRSAGREERDASGLVGNGEGDKQTQWLTHTTAGRTVLLRELREEQSTGSRHWTAKEGDRSAHAPRLQRTPQAMYSRRSSSGHSRSSVRLSSLGSPVAGD